MNIKKLNAFIGLINGPYFYVAYVFDKKLCILTRTMTNNQIFFSFEKSHRRFNFHFEPGF